MKFFTTIILFFIGLPIFAQWDNSSSIDEMTGEVSAYCSSQFVSSTKKMNFPYTDTKAFLGIGNDGKSEWVYIGFTNQPNLLNTETKDGYNVFNTRIKWDDELTSSKFIQTWGANSIQFWNSEEVVENIRNSNTVLLELEWHGSGKVYFRFNLSGSTKAVNKMRAKTGYTPASSSVTTIEHVATNIDLETDVSELEEISETKNIDEEEDDTPMMIVENMPAFGLCKSMKGDDRHKCTQMEIIKYVSNNMQYPQSAISAGIQGTVFVYFVVGKDGYVKDVKVIRNVDPTLDAEAIRVIKSLPKFEPGQQRGKNVSVQYTIPVKFIMN